MNYLIDGYNLLHAVGLLHAHRPGPQELEKARLSLLSQLHAKFAREPGQVMVIFDARGGALSGSRQMNYHGIEVQFTRNEEADDLIENFINADKSPESLTVVSNDHRIRHAAKWGGCQSRDCLSFWEWIQERPTEHQQPSEKPDVADVDYWLNEFKDLDQSEDLRKLNPYDFEFDE